MRGVLLAGGRGTRMGDSTQVANKHTLPVYDRPMIYFPVHTLRAMGCDDILVITSPDAVGDLATLLPDCTFRVQPEPNGVAGALALAEGYVDGLFPVILGDNWFSVAPPMPDGPALFTFHHSNPERFGVLHNGVVYEKPAEPPSHRVVTGLYVFDSRAFDAIRGLTPSVRGELEIADVNTWYLARGAQVVDVDGEWSDMGTPDSLLDVALAKAKR